MWQALYSIDSFSEDFIGSAKRKIPTDQMQVTLNPRLRLPLIEHTNKDMWVKSCTSGQETQEIGNHSFAHITALWLASEKWWWCLRLWWWWLLYFIYLALLHHNYLKHQLELNLRCRWVISRGQNRVVQRQKMVSSKGLQIATYSNIKYYWYSWYTYGVLCMPTTVEQMSGHDGNKYRLPVGLFSVFVLCNECLDLDGYFITMV